MSRALRGWSLGIGLLLLAAAVVLSLSLGRLPDGAGFANAANYALTTVMFLGPLTAGLTATLAGQDGRDGQHDLARSTPRGRFGSVLIVTLAGLLWGLTAHAAMLAGVLTRSDTWVLRPADGSLLLAAWSFLLLAAVIGACLGARIRSPRAGLAAAAGVFAVFYGGGYLEAWSARLTTVYPGTAYPIFMQPNALMNTGKAIITTAIAVAVLTMISRPRPAALAVSVAAAAVGISLVLSAPNWPAVPAGTTNAVCKDDREFTVCAWPQHADRAGLAIDALVALEAKVGRVYPVPTVWRESGTGVPAEDDVVIGSLPDPSAATTPGQLASDLAEYTLPTGACPDATASDARSHLSRWLYQSTNQFASDPTVPDSDVSSWVKEVARCQRQD